MVDVLLRGGEFRSVMSLRESVCDRWSLSSCSATIGAGSGVAGATASDISALSREWTINNIIHLHCIV